MVAFVPINPPSLGMPARRQQGTGSLRFRTNRWISQTRHPVTGRIVSVTHPAGTTDVEAETLHAAWLAQIAAARIDPANMTLRQLVDEWLATRDDVAPATAAQYRANLSHALEHLGERTRIAAIDVRAIDRMLVALRVNLSPGTVSNVRGTLSAVLGQAEAWQMIDRNPVPLARRSRARTATRTVVPSVDDVRKAIATIDDPFWHALFVVLAGTGCRPGEALALAWRHVDLDQASITIERTVTADAEGRKTVGVRTKTGRARTVPIGADVVDALRVWRRATADTGLWRVKPDALLWPGVADPSVPIAATIARKHWAAACDAAGVPFARVGSLRHLHASTLMAAGVPAQVVADRLGHGIEQTMTRYGVHVPDGAARSLLDRLPPIVGDATS